MYISSFYDILIFILNKMETKMYIKFQIKLIRKYARKLHIDAETAAWRWVNLGHAFHYSINYAYLKNN